MWLRIWIWCWNKLAEHENSLISLFRISKNKSNTSRVVILGGVVSSRPVERRNQPQSQTQRNRPPTRSRPNNDPQNPHIRNSEPQIPRMNPEHVSDPSRSNFQPFPQSFLGNPRNPVQDRNMLMDKQFPPDSNPNLPPAPPSYETACNPHITEPPMYTSGQNQTSSMNMSSAPPLHFQPVALPNSSQTIPQTRINSTINIVPNKRRQRRTMEMYVDDYSDDPSDYESDHDKRKMYRGYYGKRDYYDKDKDYIYYKTEVRPYG